ncbi:dUTPase [Bacillus cereus]|uniref:dUTPase n=1 Tax=Bacillus cereus TaxID=1396 RepID=UPI001D0DD75A|nr:dUTPase [Bacillus cereus]MCC2383525.1 dUTPase [Bacillus cereus]
MTDKLTELFELQSELDNRIISERNIDKSLDEWVVGITLAMESEIDEIRREVNWKWWKNEKPIDKEALQGEVIDMWHFLISLSLICGLSAEDVYRIYLEKNQENHARQDGTSTKEGYEVVGMTCEESRGFAQEIANGLIEGIYRAKNINSTNIPEQLEFDFENGGVK